MAMMSAVEESARRSGTDSAIVFALRLNLSNIPIAASSFPRIVSGNPNAKRRDLLKRSRRVSGPARAVGAAVSVCEHVSVYAYFTAFDPKKSIGNL
jgi:hypothetical protein